MNVPNLTVRLDVWIFTLSFEDRLHHIDEVSGRALAAGGAVRWGNSWGVDALVL